MANTLHLVLDLIVDGAGSNTLVLLAKSENAVVKYTMVNRGRDIERYFATKRERQFRKRGRNKLFMRKTHARATLLLIDIIQLAYIGRDIYRE